MGMKSIDLQMAFSRSEETANQLSQQQLRTAQEQSGLGMNQMRSIEEEGRKPTKLEQKDHSAIKDGGGREKERHAGGRNRKEQESGHEKSRQEHPFKGHHIDLSL